MPKQKNSPENSGHRARDPHHGRHTNGNVDPRPPLTCDHPENHESDNECDDGETCVMNMVVMEKRAATATPEKLAVLKEPAPVVACRAMSAPGAFYVGDNHHITAAMEDDDDLSSSPSTTTDGSEESSCVYIVPRASVVREEDEKDLEEGRGGTSISMMDHPLVKAESIPDQLANIGNVDKMDTDKNDRKKTLFRLSVLVCLLLIALMLGGVLYFVLRNETQKFGDKPPQRPPPSDGRFDESYSPDDRFDGSYSPDGGNGSNQKRKGGGGGGGGGGDHLRKVF